MNFKQFVAGIFSEPTGQPSFSRIAGWTALMFGCGWISCAIAWVGYVALKTKSIPDTTSLALVIRAITAFVFSVFSAYGINKGVTAWGKDSFHQLLGGGDKDKDSTVTVNVNEEKH